MTNKVTHFRKGAKVFTNDGVLEFDGTPANVANKENYVDAPFENKRGTKKVTGVGRFYTNKGINAAKRYIRKNNLNSYNDMD